MRTTKQMSVTLPHEMADMVRAKVASGEYTSESKVASAAACAPWPPETGPLRPGCARRSSRPMSASQADSDSALTPEQVRARPALLRDR